MTHVYIHCALAFGLIVEFLMPSVYGDESKTLGPHKGGVTTIAVSPDDKLLATGAKDGTIKTWDLDSLANRSTLKGHSDQVSALSFSPDGSVLALSLIHI